MKVSLIQMYSNGNKIENANKAIKMMKQSIKENPDVICLSELFLSWGKNFNGGSVEINEIKEFQDFAQKYKVNLVLGSVALKNNVENKSTNTCFVINRDGKIVERYDKKYMYKVYREDFKVDETDDTIPGNELGIVELDGIKIGIAICFDIRFPEYFRELIKQDVQIIFLPSHFRSNTGEKAWNILPEARAIENQVYFCACNQTGEGLCGNTKIISYNGEIINQIGNEEGIISAELDIKELVEFRKEFPVLEQIK